MKDINKYFLKKNANITEKLEESFSYLDTELRLKNLRIFSLINACDKKNIVLNNFISEYLLYYTVLFLYEQYEDNRKVSKMISKIINTCIISYKKTVSEINRGIEEPSKKELIEKAIKKYPDEFSLGFNFNKSFSSHIYSAYSSSEFLKCIYTKRKYGFRDLFVIFDYNEISKILTLINNSEIDIHEFAENLNPISKHNFNNIEFKKEYINFLLKILKYKKDICLKLLKYGNYFKIRNAANQEEMIKIADSINAAFNGISDGKAINSFMFIDDFYNDEKFTFTKQVSEINTIGSRTNCCFRKGGAAQSLLKPAFYSPIAGIIEGKFGNYEWFSFVWETVELNKETGTFDVSLVLDNLEATKILNKEEMDYIMNKLQSLSGYKKIYLGYCRNDIYSEFQEKFRTTQKPKERSLVEYENEFIKYSAYDDSKYLWTILERENKTKGNLITKTMDMGDLHRSKYIEWKIWGFQSDSDFVKDVILDCSFTIRNNHSIFGYLICKKYWYNPKTKNIIFKSRLTKKDNINNEDYVPLLYFDDMWMSKNKIIILQLREIFDKIKNYLKEHPEFKYYSCSCNKNSYPFLKRLKDIEIKFITDTRFNNKNNKGMMPELNSITSTIL